MTACWVTDNMCIVKCSQIYSMKHKLDEYIYGFSMGRCALSQNRDMSVQNTSNYTG